MQSNNGLLTFKTKINKVDGWAMWNKAFCIFTEIYCLKFPSKCINLVQYIGILNNLIGKFPFVQVYDNDKDFRQQMEEQPDMPWHKIDQQLWSMSLHGINTINQGQHQPQHQGGGQQRQQQFRRKQEWPLWQTRCLVVFQQFPLFWTRVFAESQPDTMRLQINPTHIWASAASLWDSAIWLKHPPTCSLGQG